MSDLSTNITGLIGGSNSQALSSSDADRNKLAKDLDSFLTLLTSQLKNQDPLSPMDSTEFTNQLVQFAQVEQQINLNESMSEVVDLTQQSIVTSAVNYMGETIEAASDQVPLQNGIARMAYGLGADSTATTVVIRDGTGEIVHTEAGQTTAGVHELTWDGTHKDTGQQLPDGTYSVEATALGKGEEQVPTWTTTFGRVTGLTNVNGTTVLLMDKVAVPIQQILSVSETIPEQQQQS
ncbi:MAG: flagellar hook assembly protein FlgD [Rhodospirillaceae bacterium]